MKKKIFIFFIPVIALLSFFVFQDIKPSSIHCKSNKPSENIKLKEALKAVDKKLNDLANSKSIAMMTASLKLNSTCNLASYPPIGVQNDQIPETFADWFAAEVLSISPKFINSNLRKDLCESAELIEGSSYLSNQDRLLRIYFANPKISEHLGYKSVVKYCEI